MEMLSMSEAEGVLSPPPPRTFDSDLFDAYDDAALETHINHAMGARINLVGMSEDEYSEFKLPPIEPVKCHSPTPDRQAQSIKNRHGKIMQKPKSKLRTSMTSSMRTNTPDEQNPEAIPYQPQKFMSSTRLKKVHISKRHLDTFGGSEYSIPSKRGIILHSDRYSWEGARPLDGSISQRDRMRLEIDYIEKLRGLKKRKEVWPHRAEMDLLMAGRRIEFEERFDLNGELQHLKSLVMPDVAKDLFHGRGIRLPGNHASVKPRPNRNYLEMYADGDVSASAPSGLRSVNPRFAHDPDIQRGWPNTQGPTGRGSDRPGVLPSINRNNNLRIGNGPESETAVSLSQARRVTKGRKPSQPPGSILPQSKPSPLPRLELHPSHSYSASREADPVVPTRELSLSPLPQTTPLPPDNSDNQQQSDSQEKDNSAEPVKSPMPQNLSPGPQETENTTDIMGNVNKDKEIDVAAANVSLGVKEKQDNDTGAKVVLREQKSLDIVGSVEQETDDTAANVGIGKQETDDTASDVGIGKQETDDTASNVGIGKQEIDDTAANVCIGKQENDDTAANVGIGKQEDQHDDGLTERVSSRLHAEEDEDAAETGLSDKVSGEITEQKSPLNPLQGAGVDDLVSVVERTELTKAFQRLDTDMDGHIQYEKLVNQLPVPSHQEQYLKQVYDISSSQSFFGVDEFITMNALANTVRDLSGPPADAFNTVNPSSLETSILRYVELFQSVDRTKKGYISMSSLREILCTTLEKDMVMEEQLWDEIVHNINKVEEERLSKVEFLSLIPYFISLSPTKGRAM